MKVDATATLFLLGGKLGKSGVCEVGHEVLCQIYARGGRAGTWLENLKQYG